MGRNGGHLRDGRSTRGRVTPTPRKRRGLLPLPLHSMTRRAAFVPGNSSWHTVQPSTGEKIGFIGGHHETADVPPHVSPRRSRPHPGRLRRPFFRQPRARDRAAGPSTRGTGSGPVTSSSSRAPKGARRPKRPSRNFGPPQPPTRGCPLAPLYRPPQAVTLRPTGRELWVTAPPLFARRRPGIPLAKHWGVDGRRGLPRF